MPGAGGGGLGPNGGAAGALGTDRVTCGIENGAPAADADVLGAGWEAGSMNTSETGVSSAFSTPTPTDRNPGPVRTLDW
jgi:hypothetical protein